MTESQAARPRGSRRTIVFVTFESEFSKSGGLGAVMSLLPQQVARYEDCILLAPHFRAITDLDALVSRGRIAAADPLPPFTLRVRGATVGGATMRGARYDVELTRVTGHDGLTTYLLWSEGFFQARSDPYANPVDPSAPMDPYTNPIDPHKLTEDALFFCAAVPQALVRLGVTHDLVLQLQDWETAPVAQAVRLEPALGRTACVLTLHNPYDRYLGDALADGSRPSARISDLVAHLDLKPDNVLTQMIPLADGPISTVSQNFALELTSDPLFTRVFADHLQPALRDKGLVGIDDGIFGERAFPFSARAQEQAEKGDFELIREEKWARRAELAQVLEEYQRELASDPGRVAWGGTLDLSDPRVPVFLVLGRDDPRQKGFDVIAEAIRRLPRGSARYVFTPIPGAEGLLGMEFLRRLARDRPGEVKVFPFRLDVAAFRALQRGSSFMVMGSLYEPFGAANEAYLAGMPVIARATGGLVQQVVPYPNASLSARGQEAVARYHPPESPPTGFLYREPSLPDEVVGWQRIVDCAYWDREPKGDRVEDRRGIPLYDAMVERAALGLSAAIDLYASDQIAYAEMIYHGFQMLDRFSWERAVAGYRRLYDGVCQAW